MSFSQIIYNLIKTNAYKISKLHFYNRLITNNR